jgi:hypothetical protein
MPAAESQGWVRGKTAEWPEINEMARAWFALF